MSKRILVTFSASCYDETTAKMAEAAPGLGADEVLVYDDVWLQDHPFRKLNRWLWDHPVKRGAGWYAWKPLVIMHALRDVDCFDLVLYVDADAYPIADLSPLFDQCDKDGGIMLFKATSHQQKAWCKQDCFMAMGQDQERYWNAQAGVARYALLQKGPWIAQQFLAEWLTYSVNPLCNTFDRSTMAMEMPGFIEHRCEQAIMTNLAHKYGLKLYREPDQHGNTDPQDRELYPQLFVHDNPRPLETRQTTAAVEGSRFRNV